MDGFVFQVLPGSETILTKGPDGSKVEWSEAQMAQQKRFKQATAYARAAMAEPHVRAVYEEMAARKYTRPYTIAFCDYFRGISRLAKE
jgi:hypothetical protein